MTDDTPARGAEGSLPAVAEPAGDEVSADGVAPVALPQDKPVWAALSNPFAVGFSLTLGGLIALALGIAFTQLATIIIYVVFALFAALGLDPVVRFLERRRLSRTWGIVIVYAAFAIVMTVVLIIVIPALVNQIALFVKNLPTEISDFQKSSFYAWLTTTFGSDVGQITDQVKKFISNPANIGAFVGGAFHFVVTVGTTISGLIIVLVLSLYFLASLPAMKIAFNRFAPARNRVKAADLVERITDSIGGYLMGMVILAFCNSIVAFLLHLFLGLPYPFLMAMLAFGITLIPLVGSVLYWLTATTLALFTGWVPALIFAIVYLIYMQIEAYYLTPKVMNKTVFVPGALVIIGALIGGTLLGLLGALVAIPVTASILLIIKAVVLPRQDAKV